MNEKLKKQLKDKGFVINKKEPFEIIDIVQSDVGYSADVCFRLKKVPTKEQLLEKAKRDYVDGVVIKDAYDGENEICTGSYVLDDWQIWNDNEAACLYFEGKWAKIIKKPVIKVQDKCLYEGDEWFQVQKGCNWVLKKFKVRPKELTDIEENEMYKRFLTKQSALDYVMNESKDKFKGCNYVKVNSGDTENILNEFSVRKILAGGSDFGIIDRKGVWVWCEASGWIAEPIKEDVPVSFPTKDEVCAEGYRIANDAGYNYRRVLREPYHDIYYSGWMDCFDWISKGNEV